MGAVPGPVRYRVETLLALVLALPASACAPTGERDEGLDPPVEHEEAALSRHPRVEGRSLEARGAVTIDPECGALTVEGTGPWMSEGDRFEQVRDGWHPRAEYGRPIAIREARSPLPHNALELVQVRVELSPSPLQPCFVRPSGGDSEELSPLECAPLWTVVEGPPEGRPQTNAQWAALVGLLDGASAVFTTPAQLERCAAGLPPSVVAGLPPLRHDGDEQESRATFVERIDISPRLTTLVLVSVVQQRIDARLEVEHEELWTVDHEGGR